MRAFFELKKNKILNASFVAYPSYSIVLTGSVYRADSALTFLYPSSSSPRSRSFFDANFNFLTSSGNPSGSIKLGLSTALDSSSFIICKTNSVQIFRRLNDLYFRNAFVKPENYTSSVVLATGAELEIPSIFYGSEVKPGSFNIYSSGASGEFTFSDDGYGGIYSASTWVGSIYYQHGIVKFNDTVNPITSAGSQFTATVNFSGTYMSPLNVYLLDIPKGEGNFSTNPSYTNYDTGSGDLKLAMRTPKTYISAIGLYDENYDLVGVIKLATPFLHDETTSGQIRAKLGF